MTKVVLIDDERDALEVLSLLLNQHCHEVEVVAQCTSADEGIAAIADTQPQMVFLDVEMPRKNGFAVLQAFPEPFFDVVFTTAYQQFALDAFKYAALDYLLKPVAAPDVVEAITRHQRRLQKNISMQQVETLLQGLVPNMLPQKIGFATQEAVHFIKPNDLWYAESNSNYTLLHLAGAERLLISKTLKEVEEMMLPYGFVRIHHSFLVNPNKVSRYLKTDGGGIELSNGVQLPVSRQRKEEVLRLLLRG